MIESFDHGISGKFSNHSFTKKNYQRRFLKKLARIDPEETDPLTKETV